MNIETLASGLVVARDKPEPKKAAEERASGIMPLPGRTDWIESLTAADKDELLAFLPTLFLRMEGGFLGPSTLQLHVQRLAARATYLSGKEFEILT